MTKELQKYRSSDNHPEARDGTVSNFIIATHKSNIE